jgi:hypothetical protein
MTKVTSHYEEALRLVRSTFVKGNTQVALNLTSTVPTDAAGWIAIFNPASNNAPGGGLAYVATAASTKGAIGVTAANATAVTVTRPVYIDLTPAVGAPITAASVN